MKPQPGIARPKPLPPLEINPPVASQGLTAADIANLLDYAEVMLHTGTDPDKARKLAELANMQRILHLRFDHKCDHLHCAGRVVSKAEYRLQVEQKPSRP